MSKILGIWPPENQQQIETDLVMLLSDPDSAPRMKRLMQFFLE